MALTPSLSIALPCFNEQDNVARVVRQAVEVGRSVTPRLEVIVVDDGSTDDTALVLGELRRRYPEVRLVRHPQNLGYGAALRSAFSAARYRHVFFTDGDGQFDLGELPAALELLGDHDVVTGYRARRCDPPWRRTFGWLWTQVTNWALGLRVRDMNCAFKILPRGLVADDVLVSTGALISAELMSRAKRDGLSIAELGVTHHPRAAGNATGGSLSVMARAIRELMRLLALRLEINRKLDFGQGALLRKAFRRRP